MAARAPSWESVPEHCITVMTPNLAPQARKPCGVAPARVSTASSATSRRTWATANCARTGEADGMSSHRNVRHEDRRAAFRPSPLNSTRASLAHPPSAGRSAAPVCLGCGSGLLRPREGSERRAFRAPQPSAPGEGRVRFRVRCQEGLGARRRPGLCVLPPGLRATLCQSDHFGCCDPVLRPGTDHASSSGFRSPWPNRTPQMVSRRLIRRGTVTSIEVAP